MAKQEQHIQMILTLPLAYASQYAWAVLSNVNTQWPRTENILPELQIYNLSSTEQLILWKYKHKLIDEALSDEGGALQIYRIKSASTTAIFLKKLFGRKKSLRFETSYVDSSNPKLEIKKISGGYFLWYLYDNGMNDKNTITLFVD